MRRIAPVGRAGQRLYEGHKQNFPWGPPVDVIQDGCRQHKKCSVLSQSCTEVKLDVGRQSHLDYCTFTINE